MKKVLLVPVLLSLVAVGAYVGPLVFAQAQPAAAPPPNKVAVINIRAVLKQNARAKAFQAELEETFKPYKARAKKLTDEIDAMSASKKPNYAVIAEKKSEWDAVNAEIVRLIEEKHKTHMPAVWSEINTVIDAAAKGYGFQIVLGYGDPDDPAVSQFQTIKTSKTRVVEEMGCTMPAYIHGSIDITNAVIDMQARRGAGAR